VVAPGQGLEEIIRFLVVSFRLIFIIIVPYYAGHVECILSDHSKVINYYYLAILLRNINKLCYVYKDVCQYHLAQADKPKPTTEHLY
jgi:hypothetical protein